MEALDAEEARLERRLKEIMKDDDARMPDISHNSADSRFSGSPIGESDLVKHYKSLFFARNSNGTSTMPSDDSGYSTTPTPRSTISSKYKTNIVPPHMKRPRSTHKQQGSISRKLNTSLMSSLPPEEIPVYFSPPALARMQTRTPQTSPVQPQDSPQNSTRGAQQDRSLDSAESKGEEPSVLQSEYEELQSKLEEAEARLKDFEQQSEKIEELERQVEDLQDTKLDAKGMSVGLQRQLTNLTTERQRFLLELRDSKKAKEELEGVMAQKDEIIKMLRTKSKLLEQKLRKSERMLAQVSSEVEVERATMTKAVQSGALKDAMYRVAELEALNHALRESVKQRHEQ